MKNKAYLTFKMIFYSERRFETTKMIKLIRYRALSGKLCLANSRRRKPKKCKSLAVMLLDCPPPVSPRYAWIIRMIPSGISLVFQNDKIL
jgi:hypothetical protein